MGNISVIVPFYGTTDAGLDVAVGLAYYAVPAPWLYLAIKRPAMRARWAVFLFSALLTAGGTAHIFAAALQANQELHTLAKALTAAISMSAAVAAWPMIMRELSRPDVARLKQELRERNAVEEALRRANRALELRVEQRMADLAHVIDVLRDEARHRQQAQQEAIKAREEALQARDQAVRARAAKSRFLATASHDLRQPLQALRLFTDYLLQIDSIAKDRGAVNGLSEALKRAEALLGAMLDLARLEAGVDLPQLRPVSIGEVLEALRDDGARMAAEKGLRLRVVGSSRLVMSEPVTLERMLRNLLQNALQYTDSGSVLVGCRLRGRHLHVEVWDTGPGIAPEHHDLIFEEFYQIGNEARDRSASLGLGLAVVRRAARLLGHEVGVCSWLGKGSVFSIGIALADS